MNPEIRDLWANALESGKFKQEQGTLTRISKDPDTEEVTVEGHCCLGVLSELAVEAGVIPAPRPDFTSGYSSGTLAYGEEGSDGFLPKEVQEWSGLDQDNPMFFFTPEEFKKIDPDWDYDEDGPIHASASDLNDTYELSFRDIAKIVRERL